MAAGSSALLQAAAIASASPAAISSPATHLMTISRERAAVFSEKWIKVPLTAEYTLDLDAMEKTSTEYRAGLYL